MIEKLRPYPEYKVVGVPWLRQIPAHWEISRSKRLFAARKELALPGDVQLSATQAYGVIPQSDFEARVGRRVVRISMHLEKRRHVEKDDFVISMRSFQGGLERAWASGAIRSSYVVLKAQTGVDVGYFAHLFKSHGYIRALQATADFIRDGQDLNFSNFASVDLPLPPLAEQAIMGRFLYHANRSIDRFIRAKRRLIALLNEQKQAIIHRAVTRGLNPNVPVRDSGMPWLAEVPAHWEMMPNRAFLRIRKNIVGKQSGKHVLLSLTMKGIVPRDMENPTGKFPAEFDAYQVVLPGDLVFCFFDVDETPRTVGQSHLSGMITGAYTVFECREPEIAAFLFRFYLTMDNGKLLKPLYTGLRKVIPKQTFLAAKTPIPPPHEQRAIVEFVDAEFKKIDVAIDRAECEIALIREYRTRLLVDVVTGQLDVRDAAARLPASDPDEPAPADLDDAATDDDLDEGEPE
jgi:type I restriction enzyme, S subunit